MRASDLHPQRRLLHCRWHLITPAFLSKFLFCQHSASVSIKTTPRICVARYVSRRLTFTIRCDRRARRHRARQISSQPVSIQLSLRPHSRQVRPCVGTCKTLRFYPCSPPFPLQTPSPLTSASDIDMFTPTLKKFSSVLRSIEAAPPLPDKAHDHQLFSVQFSK